MTRTVVITGASAGIGRAAAELFGRRGDSVALIARGEDGLAGAARAVEEAGGRALAIPADVADYEAVERAAERVEAELGPIDVWVNVAFTSVFAPFWEITPAEFRRVTEVSYLGFVHGTMAALARMRPRNRGTIVQVGSALGYRAIPLQSAYCGAKHAINGFTESIRCELLHEGSKVRITIVQMPAVNTPQFSWVLSRLPRHPQPVPPIYEPEVAAQGVLFAAEHADRKEHWVGASTAGTIMAQKFVAPVLDRYLAKTGYDSQQTGEPVAPDRPNNLWQPVDRSPGSDHGAHGVFDDRSKSRSIQLTVTERVEEAGSTVRRTVEQLIGAARERAPQRSRPWSAATSQSAGSQAGPPPVAHGAPAGDGGAPPADAPLADAPSADTPSADAPLADAPLADAPSADAPSADTPLADTSTTVTPLADPDTAVVDHDTSVPDIDPSLPEPNITPSVAEDASSASANRHSFLDDVTAPLAEQDGRSMTPDVPVADEDAAWTEEGGTVAPTQVDVPAGQAAPPPAGEGGDGTAPLDLERLSHGAEHAPAGERTPPAGPDQQPTRPS